MNIAEASIENVRNPLCSFSVTTAFVIMVEVYDPSTSSALIYP